MSQALQKALKFSDLGNSALNADDSLDSLLMTPEYAVIRKLIGSQAFAVHRRALAGIWEQLSAGSVAQFSESLALTGIDASALNKIDPRSLSETGNFRLLRMDMPEPHEQQISIDATSERHQDCSAPHPYEQV